MRDKQLDGAECLVTPSEPGEPPPVASGEADADCTCGGKGKCSFCYYGNQDVGCGTFTNPPPGRQRCEVLGKTERGEQRHTGHCNTTMRATGRRACEVAAPAPGGEAADVLDAPTESGWWWCAPCCGRWRTEGLSWGLYLVKIRADGSGAVRDKVDGGWTELRDSLESKWFKALDPVAVQRLTTENAALTARVAAAEGERDIARNEAAAYRGRAELAETRLHSERNAAGKYLAQRDAANRERDSLRADLQAARAEADGWERVYKIDMAAIREAAGCSETDHLVSAVRALAAKGGA